MKEPYGNGSGCNPIWEREDLEPVINKADAADLQIAVHAIGAFSVH
jgi:predicted amidohydrolase YtcJ